MPAPLSGSRSAGVSEGREKPSRGALSDQFRSPIAGVKTLGAFLRHAPMLIVLMLFVWSFSMFKRLGISHLNLSISSQISLCSPPSGIVERSALLGGMQRELGGGGGGGSAGERGELAEREENAAMRRILHQAEQMIGKFHEVPYRQQLEEEVEDEDEESEEGKEGPISDSVAAYFRKVAKGKDKVLKSIPSLSIFCAPKPYTPEKHDPQRRALLSWLRLTPPPKIVLLGSDPTFNDLAAEFPGRISVESQLDYNFYGVPLFHSMIARAQAADTELSMIINGDIILLNDIMLSLAKVHSSFKDFILTAARWDVAQDFPFSFDPEVWSKNDGKGENGKLLEEQIREYARGSGSLHTYGGVDFWLWNNSPMPLFAGAMPPFAFGRGKYDNWLTHEAVTAGFRDVVDASEAVTTIHVAHSYAHVAEADKAKASGGIPTKLNFWSTRKQSSWELFANIHMAQSTGSYTNQKGTALHIPWRMTSCHEPKAMGMCLQRRLRPANCSCEYSPYVAATQSDPKLEGRHWTCGTVSVDKKQDFTINPVAHPKSVAGLPHTMEQLLPQVAKKVDDLKVVILVAVTFGYAEMLMSFICRLRALGLADNLVVAALDEDLYRFSFTQGLAVYYEQGSTRLKGIDSKDCQFGSQCFRQFTKLKSRSVLHVLKAGYSVLWTDVDIVWFKDPLPELLSFGTGSFPIQSNEPNASLPGTGIRRINSGFYFARADAMTVEAFEAITAHAATTSLSEQPSFYDVLCGVGGELLVPGKEECVWTNGLKTVFLDRAGYPNGAVHKFWEAKDVEGACAEKGCTILHNNWIAGKDAKRERLVKNNFWHYDAERRMCMWPWHARLPKFGSKKGSEEENVSGG